MSSPGAPQALSAVAARSGPLEYYPPRVDARRIWLFGIESGAVEAFVNRYDWQCATRNWRNVWKTDWPDSQPSLSNRQTDK
jgi:hypothetical protein